MKRWWSGMMRAILVRNEILCWEKKANTGSNVTPVLHSNLDRHWNRIYSINYQLHQTESDWNSLVVVDRISQCTLYKQLTCADSTEPVTITWKNDEPTPDLLSFIVVSKRDRLPKNDCSDTCGEVSKISRHRAFYWQVGQYNPQDKKGIHGAGWSVRLLKSIWRSG